MEATTAPSNVAPELNRAESYRVIWEEPTVGKRRETGQALFAAFATAIILTPIFWVIGVLHFGAITGADPTIGAMVSYVLWTSVIGVLVAAPLLTLLVRPRRLGYRRASVVAAAALAPIQAATWVVTLYQWGNDELVVISALCLALAAVVLLTKRLSDPIARPVD